MLPILNIVSLALAITFLIVLFVTWDKATVTAYAVKTVLTVLLVIVNVMLGNTLLVVLWSITSALNLIVLATK